MVSVVDPDAEYWLYSLTIDYYYWLLTIFCKYSFGIKQRIE